MLTAARASVSGLCVSVAVVTLNSPYGQLLCHQDYKPAPTALHTQWLTVDTTQP